MSRRTSRTREVFSSCPEARWKRRLNCSFLSLASCSSSWSAVMALNSCAFMIASVPVASGLSPDDPRFDGELRRTERKGLARGGGVDTIELKHDAARLDAADPQLRRALPGAHAHLRRLLGDGHVREHPDPHPAGALHGTRDGPPGRLDLASGEAVWLHRLEAVGPKIELGPALGLAMDAALEGLAEFGARWLQHSPSSRLGRLGLALTAGCPADAASAAAPAPAPADTAFLRFDGAGRGGHRVVLHDLALEDPDLHADHSIGGLSKAIAKIDVGAQGVQRHAPLTVPFDARDLRAPEPARAVDADAEGTQPDRRLHRSLHGAAERHASLELLGNGLCHQRRIDLGLSHLDDIEVYLRGGEPGELSSQLFDIGPLLADQHAGPRGMHRHAALLVWALDHDFGNPCLPLLLQDVVADVHVLVQQAAVLAAIGEPTAIPRAVDADPQADRIDLVTH